MGGENKDKDKTNNEVTSNNNVGSHPDDAETNVNSSINTTQLTPDVILALTRQQTAESEVVPVKRSDSKDKKSHYVGKNPPPPPRDEKYSDSNKKSDKKADKKIISVAGNHPRDEKMSTYYDSVKAGKKSISGGSRRARDEKSSSVNTQLSSDEILSLTRYQTEGGEVDLSTTTEEFGVDNNIMPTSSKAHDVATTTLENSHADSDHLVVNANPLPLRRELRVDSGR